LKPWAGLPPTLPQQGPPTPRDPQRDLDQQKAIQFDSAFLHEKLNRDLQTHVQELQQQAVEDVYPAGADPKLQAIWMAKTLAGGLDHARIQRRASTAPPDQQALIVSHYAAQDAARALWDSAGVPIGRQYAKRATGAMGWISAFGRGAGGALFLNKIPLDAFKRAFEDDDRQMWDEAESIATTGQSPSLGGQLAHPTQQVLDRNRQRDVLYAAMKSSYAEEMAKVSGSEKLGMEALKGLGMLGALAAPMTAAGKVGAMAGRAILGAKAAGPGAQFLLGVAGATAAGGGYSALQDLPTQDLQVVADVTETEGAAAGKKAASDLKALRIVQGAATWGIGAFTGGVLGKAVGGAVERVAGKVAGETAKGAAMGGAFAAAGSHVDLPFERKAWEAIAGKDPGVTTALAQVIAVQMDPRTSTDQRVEAWKAAAVQIAPGMASFGAYHFATAFGRTGKPADPATAVADLEVASRLASEARAEVGEKTPEVAKAILPELTVAEEQPTEVPLARPGDKLGEPKPLPGEAAPGTKLGEPLPLEAERQGPPPGEAQPEVASPTAPAAPPISPELKPAEPSTSARIAPTTETAPSAPSPERPIEAKPPVTEPEAAPRREISADEAKSYQAQLKPKDTFRFQNLLGGRELEVVSNEGGITKAKDGERTVTLIPDAFKDVDPASVKANPAALEGSYRPEEMEGGYVIKIDGKDYPVTVKPSEKYGVLAQIPHPEGGTNYGAYGQSVAAAVGKIAEKWGGEPRAVGRLGVETEAAMARVREGDRARMEEYEAAQKEQAERLAEPKPEKIAAAATKDIEAVVGETPPAPEAPPESAGPRQTEMYSGIPVPFRTILDVIIGPRGRVDPRGESLKDTVNRWGGGESGFKRTVEQSLRGVLGPDAILGPQIMNKFLRAFYATRTRFQHLVKELRPLLRLLPRDDEFQATAWRYLDKHTPEAIAALRDMGKARGLDQAAIEKGLERVRDIHKEFRQELIEHHPDYQRAMKELARADKMLAREDLKAKERARYEEIKKHANETLEEMSRWGFEEYIHHVVRPQEKSFWDNLVRKIVKSKEPMQKTVFSGATLERTGAEAVENVFLSLDDYFYGVTRKIEYEKALRELDPLINGTWKRAGNSINYSKVGDEFWRVYKPEGFTHSIRELVKFGGRGKEGTVRVNRYDTGEEQILSEKDARQQLMRKRGGVVEAAERAGSKAVWRVEELNKFLDAFMGRDLVKRSEVEKILDRSTSFVRGYLAANALGWFRYASGWMNFLLGQLSSAGHGGLYEWTKAMAQSVTPKGRALVEASGVTSTTWIGTEALSEGKLFPKFRERMAKGGAEVVMHNFSLAEKPNRSVAYLMGRNMMDAYGKRNGLEVTDAMRHEAGLRTVLETQGIYDRALSARWFRNWAGKSVFMFRRPQIQMIENLFIGGMRSGDWTPLIRTAIYAGLLDQLVGLGTEMLLGRRYSILPSFGMTAGDLPQAAEDEMRKRLGKGITSGFNVPGFGGGVAELPPMAQIAQEVFQFFTTGKRPERIAERAMTLVEPGGKMAQWVQQMRSARPVKGEPDMVDVPHAATTREALDPTQMLTGASRSKMERGELQAKPFVPGRSERSLREEGQFQRFAAEREEGTDKATQRNDAFYNYYRAKSEGRVEAAQDWRKKYLGLVRETGRKTEQSDLRERIAWRGCLRRSGSCRR